MRNTFYLYLLPIPADGQLTSLCADEWVQRLLPSYYWVAGRAQTAEDTGTWTSGRWLVNDVTEMTLATESALKNREARLQRIDDPAQHCGDLFRLIVHLYMHRLGPLRMAAMGPALGQLRHLAETSLRELRPTGRYPALDHVLPGTFACIELATPEELAVLAEKLQSLPRSTALRAGRRHRRPRPPRARLYRTRPPRPRGGGDR